MKNAEQPANIITVIADRDYKSGDLTQIGAMIGVIAFNAKKGEEAELSTVGGYACKSDPALVASFEQPTPVDIDVANMQVVEAGSGDNPLGVVIWKDANTDPGYTSVRLNGVAVDPVSTSANANAPAGPTGGANTTNPPTNP